MAAGDIFSFGPYILDTEARRLTRDGIDVRIASREMDLLLVFVSHPGQLLSKDLLIDIAWSDVAVSPGSLDQAIHRLRKTLTRPGDPPYIETQTRRGCRFITAASRVNGGQSDEALDALLQTHGGWVEGRAAIESLDCNAIARARDAFSALVARDPKNATAHIGLANAYVMQFEMTRVDALPDVAALQAALLHARAACQLDKRIGEAWATLGFVFDRSGQNVNAQAAVMKAVDLEPDNWRHHLRLSAVSWGDARLTEAHRTLKLLPGLLTAHWLAATVFVARGVLDQAELELVAGVTESADLTPQRYSGVGLHWLLGLIELARGDSARALASLERELGQEHSGHLYARECAANTWYAIGATRWRQNDTDGARAAFEECLSRVPAHPFARAVLGLELPPSIGGSPVNLAIAEAIACAARNDSPGCAAVAAKIDRALVDQSAGRAGWLLPVEPMLNLSARPESWVRPLASLRSWAA